jgi:hypothetical protein
MKAILFTIVSAFLAADVTGAPIDAKREAAATIDRLTTIAPGSSIAWDKRETAAPIDRLAAPGSSIVWNKREAAAPIDRLASPVDESWAKREAAPN